MTEVMPNHTYEVERSGQFSIQNKICLKPFGQALVQQGRPLQSWSQLANPT